MSETITRITVVPPGLPVCRESTETYYAPRAPRGALRELRAAGFRVHTRRVSAGAEIARQLDLAASIRCDGAAAQGASSYFHAAPIWAARHEARARAARDAMAGKDTLTHRGA